MLESFTLKPEVGVLDVGTLLSALRRSAWAVELVGRGGAESGPAARAASEFVVCASSDQAHRVRTTVAGAGTLDAFHGTIGTLRVAPDGVYAYQLATPAVVARMRGLLVPLVRSQRCRVFSETTERTADFADHPERLFDP